MEYICKNPNGKYARDQIWKGEIRNLRRTGTIIEAEVKGRGSSLHVIVGEYEYGRYLCIPSWKVGSELAGLTDVFWNQEQLERQIGTVDAITVAEALNVISNELESMA